MATTISTTLRFGMLTRETLDDSVVPGVLSQDVLHNAFEVKKALDGSSTPPVSLVHERTVTASASGTIDLTSLTTTEGTRSALGLKLVAMRITNRGTNAAFSLTVGASNGYVVGGVAHVAPIGGSVMVDFVDTLADVGASTKNLDYTFHASDEADITMIFG
jgi:hypothetical protein